MEVATVSLVKHGVPTACPWALVREVSFVGHYRAPLRTSVVEVVTRMPESLALFCHWWPLHVLWKEPPLPEWLGLSSPWQILVLSPGARWREVPLAAELGASVYLDKLGQVGGLPLMARASFLPGPSITLSIHRQVCVVPVALHLTLALCCHWEAGRPSSVGRALSALTLPGWLVGETCGHHGPFQPLTGPCAAPLIS